MKAILLTLSLLITTLLFAQTGQNLHNYVVDNITGSEYDLSQLKGKKVLVVNTASKCGLTPQYEDLEKLYKQYGGDNFIIIGFPANNFMKQEPGSNEEIAEFCQLNYGVTFPMMSKISVKGSDIHPLFKWLTDEAGSEVQWNFQKFMINPDGTYADFVSPRTKPFDPKIVSWIEE